MTSIFTADTSTQGIGGITNIKTFNSKDDANIKFFQKSGIYNSANNEIKLFTNNIDALTIDANQKVICNGSLITNLDWNKIDAKPSIFPTNWDNVASKPSIFPTNWDNVASKPSIFPTNWDNISSKPSIFPTNWDNISSKPTFATVATSGLYNDLLSIPSIFPTNWDNISSKPSIFPTNWDNISSKPSIFPTNWDNISSKPSIFPTNWENVSSKPDIFTKIETSNIFITSNVLSNTSNDLFKSIGNSSLINYFSKSETSNIFTTSNHIQNSLNFINYNNINNKPWINSGTNIYNSNLSGNLGIGTANPISKLTINVNNTDYPNLDVNPHLWYKFDTSSIGLSINDGSLGSSYNLTNNSSVAFESNDYIKGNGSASFSTNKWLTINNNLNFTGKSFSFSFWAKVIYVSGQGQYAVFGENNNVSSNGAIYIQFLTDGSSYLQLFINWIAGNTVHFNIDLSDLYNWRHYVITFDHLNKITRLYKNGLFLSSYTGSTDIPSRNQIFTIGKVLDLSIYFNGLIDDFRIYYYKILTATEVSDLYDNNNLGLILNANSNVSNFQLKLYPYTINNSNNGFSYKLVDNRINLNSDILSLYASGNTGKIGIGTKTPISELDIIGTTYITSNVHIGNIPLSFIHSFSNSTLISITGTNENYLQFTGNGNLILNEPCSCDLLLVGAGGNGGGGDSSGGGGGGEVIFFPNFPLRNGTLNITVGFSSTTFSNRTSKISLNTGSDIIYALGGGDGGLNKIFITNGSITVDKSAIALYNYTNSVNISSGTYSITFSNGSITLTALTPDKSYPLLKDGSGNTINPDLWYKFDTNLAGLLINDGSLGSSYSLTNNGSVQFESTDLIKGNGSSFFANTGNRFFLINNNLNFTGKSFSFSFWAKVNYVSGQGQYGLFGENNNVQSNGAIYIQFLTDGSTYLQLFINWIAGNTLFFDLNVSDIGQWRHYVITFNNDVSTTTTILYKNGTVVNTFSRTTRIPSRNQPFTIGNLLNLGIYYRGYLDDFRLYDNLVLTSTQVSELYNGRVNIFYLPTTGGSGGGGGANNQIGSATGTKFDEYKSFSSSGFTGTASTGGNGGSALTTTRYTTTITGSSLSVGLGGNGVGSSGPTNGVNYGDGGSGNGGVGANGLIIIRFKETQYLQTKGIRDNANTGLILNGNDNTNKSQLRLYPYSEIYPPTQSVIRGFSLRTLDGNNNYDLLNLLATFGGRIGIKTKIPFATLDVNGDLKCKQLFIEANEPFGVSCQVMNLNPIGQSGFFIGGGQGATFGGINIFYSPDTQIAELNNGNSTGDLLLKTYNANSYIRLINSNGNVGIGTYPNNTFRLHVNGAINSSSLTTDTVNSSSISTSSISLNNGNISLAGTIGCVQLNTGPISCSSINLTGGNINNGGTFNGTATQARYLLANTNEWHISKDNRQRVYFTDDTSVPSNSHTVFKTGSLTHYFQDKDGTDYCLLDRFGISTYFEVISGGSYDNVGIADGSYTGVYVYRRMVLRLSTFTEIHRCFCEDELYTNYDDFINEYLGRVVVSKGAIKTAFKKEKEDWQILDGKEGITINDSHPIVELSRTKKNKAVVGVITKRDSQDYPGRLVINSLGETAIYVVNTNGNIENGDLITTSDELGYGERQTLNDGTPDDTIRNYTIGKCLISCDFELNNPNYKCEVIDTERDLRRCFLPIFIYSG